MILSLIGVAFYAIIWFTNKSGANNKIPCLKKRDKKKKGSFRLRDEGSDEEDKGVSKLDKGGRFPGFGQDFYESDSLVTLN